MENMENTQEITFNINIHKNSLLIKGEIPDDFETFELIGKFIDSLSKLNKELEIVILFDMKKVPFMFIMYLNKIQKTMLREEIEMQFTVVSKDLELKKFLEDFKNDTNTLASNGINPFQDIMDTMGAGETSLDEVIIPDSLKDNMPEDIKNGINKINSITPDSLQDLSNKNEDGLEEMEDINIEELNKIKFIYKP